MRFKVPGRKVPTRVPWRGRTFFALALVGWVGCDTCVRADDPVPSKTLTLSELPPVPDDLLDLVEGNEIEFLVGGTRPSLVNPSRSTGTRGRRFDGETQFRLSYTFNSRCKWDIVKDSSTPDSVKQLAVQVRFTRVEMAVRHQMWFREVADLKTFWESPLVRHEFDHVRISSDPRIEQRFKKAVQEHERIELSRAESEPLIAVAYRQLNATWFRRGTILNHLSSDKSRRFVKEQIQDEFDRIVELVEIRYAELDRLTDHGRFPVPDTGPLKDWLNR